jgi:TldD protein
MEEELADYGLEIASKLGATYADIRFVENERRTVSVSNGRPERLSHSLGSGFGVRTIANGGWGFAGSREISKNSVKKTVELAIKVAKATALKAKGEVKLTKTPVVKGTYESDVKKDPLKVPLENVLDLLIAADRAFREKSSHVRFTSNDIEARRDEKYIATSEGSKVKQKIVFCGGSGQGVVLKDGMVQRRSYEANFMTRGYENIEEVDFVGMASQAGEEAEKILDAEKCPTEIKADLILDDSHLGLQIHETIGHASELDRVLGREVDMAGMSFLTLEKKGKLRYGSPMVNFVADATAPKGLGSFGYDDECVPAKKVYLVKEGIMTGYQSSRETAAEIGDKESSGAMRADSPLHAPIVRMTNINLLPGDWKSEEIIEDTKNGIICRGTKMWSIDQMRLNFQFGTEIAYWVKDGEIGKVVRDPTYTGISYEFWGSVDAIAKDGWEIWGTTGCGKGKPGQSMYVGHGSSRTRIKNVRIGVTGGA